MPKAALGSPGKKAAPAFVSPILGGLETLDQEPAVREVRGKERTYASQSIFCLRPGHEPRRSAIRIVEAPYFDPFILTTIILNCITMASESPLDPEGTAKSRFIRTCEWAFLAVFTCEMVVKIIAYGFLLHRGAYLRDAWCQLDFVVVMLAWLPILFPSMGNYSVLRAFRALRPLRALKRVPGMPLLVQWILSVLPKMGNGARRDIEAGPRASLPLCCSCHVFDLSWYTVQS